MVGVAQNVAGSCTGTQPCVKIVDIEGDAEGRILHATTIDEKLNWNLMGSGAHPVAILDFYMNVLVTSPTGSAVLDGMTLTGAGTPRYVEVTVSPQSTFNLAIGIHSLNNTGGVEVGLVPKPGPEPATFTFTFFERYLGITVVGASIALCIITRVSIWMNAGS